MEQSKAMVRYIRVSPRKARLVADLVKGSKAGDAVNVLKYTPKKAAIIIKKLIESAMANATNNLSVADAGSMIVDTIAVDGAAVLKRFRPRAMGRASRIRKRTSHITVILKSN